MKGEENTVVDTLSQMPEELPEREVGLLGAVGAVMTVSANPKLSGDIQSGYKSDSFCQEVLTNLDSFPSAEVVDGLIFLGSRLVVPVMISLIIPCFNHMTILFPYPTPPK